MFRKLFLVRKEKLFVCFYFILKYTLNSEELRDYVFQINSLSIRQSISQTLYLFMVLLCLNKSILTWEHSYPQKFRQIFLKTKMSQYLGHSDFTSPGFTLLLFVGGRSFKILFLPDCKIKKQRYKDVCGFR